MIKKWCILCICVQIIFILEYVSSFYIIVESSDIKLSFTLFAITPLIWWLIKPMVQKGYLLEGVNKELKKVIFSMDYIQVLQENSGTLPNLLEGMVPIWLGNSNARNTVTVVANPTCNACSKHISELINLLTNKQEFNVRIILASNTDVNIIGDRVALQLMSLPEIYISEKTIKWFTYPDIRNMGIWK